MTTLKKLTATKQKDGSWHCTREREETGESASLESLADFIDWILMHELDLVETNKSEAGE